MNPKTEKWALGPSRFSILSCFTIVFLNCKLHLKQLLTSVGCKSIHFISPKLYDTNKILHTIFIFIAKHLDHYNHYRLKIKTIWRILKMPLLLVSSFKEKEHLVVDECTTHRKFYTPWWIWSKVKSRCYGFWVLYCQIASHSRWFFLIF